MVCYLEKAECKVNKFFFLLNLIYKLMQATSVLSQNTQNKYCQIYILLHCNNILYTVYSCDYKYCFLYSLQCCFKVILQYILCCVLINHQYFTMNYVSNCCWTQKCMACISNKMQKVIISEDITFLSFI